MQTHAAEGSHSYSAVLSYTQISLIGERIIYPSRNLAPPYSYGSDGAGVLSGGRLSEG